MTRILHLTDIHLTAPETEDSHQYADTVATLERMVGIIAAMTPAPDAVVASGDLTNIGDPASYRLLARMMAGLKMPVLYTLGNHDRREAFFTTFPDHPAGPEATVDHDAVIGDLHLVLLDSLQPGQVSGGLSPAQLDYAEEMLARHPDLPKIVAIHHPPRLDPDAPYAWETLDAGTTARLGDLLAGRGVAAVLTGHIHTNRVTLWRGIPVVSTIGQQSGVDETRARGMTILEDGGFAICDLLPEGVQVTFSSLRPRSLIRELPDDLLSGFS
ncbi:metallophosphoesterase family protein [Pseudodonghicola flavimaris]|uniref:Metallophosphoesterase n=1 Tax=Pseudodonghicola flavimaris TaxID=3050036 RepID=A0ABT7EWM6_9RHOB|nr:metallophosphoesterase [Pseudodonghicola flavimaris]MDK3016744.1 metallophosphoesterase [Pseudodonghicola flavimaris]